MPKILVTGSNGFIGKHVVRLAKERGYEVVTFDLKEHDILDLKRLKQSIRGCDAVIHLAAIVTHQKEFGSGLYNNYQTNVTGFLNVIELTYQEDIKKFVYASSSAVYGRFGHLSRPFKEDMKIIYSDEENHYAKTKMVNEMIAASYHDQFGLTTIGVRVMNAYGPGELEKGDAACAIGHMIQTKFDKKTIEIYGDGNQAKDFIYITDCANMFLDLLGKAPDGVYNVGTGISTNFNTLAGIVGGKAVHVPNPHKYYPLLVVADTRKTFDIIGKRSLISVKEGIAKTIQYYQKIGWTKPKQR
jgi:nucleoside-diphosphate-sugar epimerase